MDVLLRFDGLYQPLRKLTSVSFVEIRDLNNNDIEEFLKRNSQLENLEIRDCPRVDDRIVQQISEHALGIRTLYLQDISLTTKKNAKYYGQLSNLQSLSLKVPAYSGEHVLPYVVLEIAEAKIPLEHLLLYGCLVPDCAVDLFIEGILKLRKLRTLSLGYVEGLDATHIMEICGRLKKLHMDMYSLPTAQNILDILRIGEKLECLNLCYTFVQKNYKQIQIDVDTFRQMVEVVRNRPRKIHLKLALDRDCYAAEIPAEELVEAQDSLTLNISERSHTQEEFDPLMNFTWRLTALLWDPIFVVLIFLLLGLSRIELVTLTILCRIVGSVYLIHGLFYLYFFSSYSEIVDLCFGYSVAFSKSFGGRCVL